MLKFRNLFLVFAILFCFSASGQNHSDSTLLSEMKVKRVRYFSQYVSGGMVSDNNSGLHFTFTTVQGAQFGRFGIGIGLSYDAYGQWSSVPLLAVCKTEIAKIKNNSVYLQLAGGYGKLWHKETDEEYLSYQPERSNKLEALLGYQISTEKLKVHICGGFRSQELHYSQGPRWWIYSYPGTTQTAVTRTINGLVLQLGIGF
jgi:hypothetical protein